MLSLINNLGSMVAQGNLSNANNALSTSLQRLSSGLRINSGADDPAGLVISQVQQAQMSGLQAAITNTSNATNVVQTADGGLNEINALLVQIRGLAVSAANSGATDSNMLAADQAQIGNALDTITRIATSTQYGKDQLLDGSHAATASQTGGNSNDVVNITNSTQSGGYSVAITQQAKTATFTAGAAFNGSGLTNAETVTINGVQIQMGAGTKVTTAKSDINNATASTGVGAYVSSGTLTLYTTKFGSGQSMSVTTSVAGGGSDDTGLASGTFADGKDVQGKIDGFDATGVGNTLTSTTGNSTGLSITFAADSTTPSQTADGTSTTITANVDTSKGLIFQVGANGGQNATLTIANMKAAFLGMNVQNSSSISNLSQINVADTNQSSTDILNVIDQAITDVSTLAGDLGAFQDNTLQATAANLQASLQNTTAANSTIRDTNFAAESTNYAQNQVLVQAGTQVLKNANQLPQLVLTLLQ